MQDQSRIDYLVELHNECSRNLSCDISVLAGSTVMLSEIDDLPPVEYTVHPRQRGFRMRKSVQNPF